MQGKNPGQELCSQRAFLHSVQEGMGTESRGWGQFRGLRILEGRWSHTSLLWVPYCLCSVPIPELIQLWGVPGWLLQAVLGCLLWLPYFWSLQQFLHQIIIKYAVGQ